MFSYASPCVVYKTLQKFFKSKELFFSFLHGVKGKFVFLSAVYILGP